MSENSTGASDRAVDKYLRDNPTANRERLIELLNESRELWEKRHMLIIEDWEDDEYEEYGPEDGDEDNRCFAHGLLDCPKCYEERE